MRTLALVASAALVAGCASSSSRVSTADPADAPARAAAVDPASDTAPIDARAAVIAVRGLSCPKCATGVDQQLAKIDGVESVKVDFSTGDVTVRFDELHPRPTPAQLRRAVEDSGFTFVSITPRS